MKIKAFFIFCFFLLLPSPLYADQALIQISADLQNIAISKSDGPYKTKPKKKTDAKRLKKPPAMPFKGIRDEYAKFRKKTKLGRTVSLKWEIVNYEPSEQLFSSTINGYHLFKFTWYRHGFEYRFKNDDGTWTNASIPIAGMRFKPKSEATIIGFGNVPILITTAMDFDFLIGGSVKNIEYKREIVKDIVTDNYEIKIIKYPITRSAFVLFNPSRILNDKITLKGHIILGDSIISTERQPNFYPFDKYSFDIFFTSNYPSHLVFKLNDVEDLNLSAQKEIEFEIKENQSQEAKFHLNRIDPYKMLVWPLFGVLIPLLFNIIQRRKLNFLIRIIAYCSAFVIIYIFLPTPLNVPKLNLLNIVTWGLFILTVIVCELYINQSVLFNLITNSKKGFNDWKDDDDQIAEAGP